MDKNNKNVKKTVIRNVKQPLSSTGTVTTIKSARKLNKIDSKTTTKTLNIPQLNFDSKSIKTDNKTTTTLDVPQLNSDRKSNKTSLSVPELNSTLEIVRKIDTLRNQTKTTTHLTNEMLTRKLNFPYEQRVYKNLVPLQTTKTSQLQQPIMVREPLRFKDKEPKLCDFIETTQKNNEYYYRPTVVRKPIVNSRVDFDSLKLYRILNSN